MLKQTSSNMKIAKKNKVKSLLINPIIALARKAYEEDIKKVEYIAINCHNTPDEIISGTYEINLPYYVGGIQPLKSCYPGKRSS